MWKNAAIARYSSKSFKAYGEVLHPTASDEHMMDSSCGKLCFWLLHGNDSMSIKLVSRTVQKQVNQAEVAQLARPQQAMKPDHQ